jgi:hypothetical protein
MSAPRAHDAADRKRQLIADSARARKRLASGLAPVARAEASAQALAEGALHVIRQPAVLAAIALLVMLAGPGRLLRGLRWIAFALPMSPMGRRLLPMLVRRVTAWLNPSRPR